MNAKEAYIEYCTALEWARLELARRMPLRGLLRPAIITEDSMKVYNESKYLKFQDLNDHDVVVTIANVTREEIKNKDQSTSKKFVLHFKELEKGLVLNATNMNTLYKLLNSDESDEWIGKRITLYTKDDIEMGGEIVSGLRIRGKLPL